MNDIEGSPKPDDEKQHPWKGADYFREKKGPKVWDGYDEYVSPVVAPILDKEAQDEERVRRELEVDGILPATKLG